MTDAAPLTGRRVAVPESRELDVFATMLERRGATVLRCPLVSILDAPDPAPVLDWLRRFSQGACDDLILLTGEGLRRLLSCLERHAPELRPAFLEQLAHVRKVVRGPKPGRALRELDLKPDLAAEIPTTEGIISLLRTLDLRERRVGVQLYGEEPNLPLMEFLHQAGAQVLAVAPYVYADAASDVQVLKLIAELAAGGVDAIAFTSKSQVDRLFKLATSAGQLQALYLGLERSLIAAIGPVVADLLTGKGVRVDLMPEDSFFMKPLTTALVAALSSAAPSKSDPARQ
jgi:uroporphyrinogen-III synthase